MADKAFSQEITQGADGIKFGFARCRRARTFRPSTFAAQVSRRWSARCREGRTRLDFAKLLQSGASCTDAPFTDMPTGHPFCPEIQWMKENQVSTGFDDQTYRPSDVVTRAAMSAFMARLAGVVELDDCVTPPFSDVPIEQPFCPEIRWMAEQGISTGFDDGTYRPANAVSRQAMSAFLARLSPPSCTAPPFSDVPADHQFCKEINWMKTTGISTGFSDGTYGPSLVVTRQAMSASCTGFPPCFPSNRKRRSAQRSLPGERTCA